MLVERWTDFRLGVEYFGGPFYIQPFFVVFDVFVFFDIEMLVQFADEIPVLGIGHLGDLKHLVTDLITSNAIDRISCAESPS